MSSIRLVAIRALIYDTFRDTRDKKLFWVLVAASTAIALSFACIRFDAAGWSLFFGAVRIPVPFGLAGRLPAADVMSAFVAYKLVDVYLAWLGTLACLIATAGLLPDFLAAGMCDVVFGKPLSRVTIFLGKYAGALCFVAFQSGYFVLLTFLVLWLHAGEPNWAYWWAVPLLIAQFSYLYCVLALVAVISRRTLVSLLAALFLWIAVWGVTQGAVGLSLAVDTQTQELRLLDWEERPAFARGLSVARRILPKTIDVPLLLARRLGAVSISEFDAVDPLSLSLRDPPGEAARSGWNPTIEQALFKDVTLIRSVGSSLIFEGVILVAACWIFVRRDY